MVSDHHLSERRACRLVGLSRDSYRHPPQAASGATGVGAPLAQGVAQDEFASIAGISRSHMSKIERGEHVPTLPLILKISTALKMSAAELIGATERNLCAAADADS